MANKHCRKFEEHNDYLKEIRDGKIYIHNLSYCKIGNEVHYDNDIIINYYSSLYFTIEALNDGNVYFKYLKWSPISTQRYIEYSKDNGKTWNRTTNVENQESIMSIPLLTGETALVRGDNDTFASYLELDADYYNSNFYSDIEFNVYGNIMSLLYKDNFLNKYEISKYAFKNLFFDSYRDSNHCFLVNAKNLILPATTLANYCYSWMFNKCKNLITAPELPATTLAKNCYTCMFSNCTSLTTAPKLPITTLADTCYQSMFSGCTSLTTAPELPATTLADHCYGSMFGGCTSLTTAPELPATTLADYCYNTMFNGCTNLTTAPKLPATTLANYCYWYMFNGCTSLTTAPELPATTLADNCYLYMFLGCTSLTTAPELPATTLAPNCYGYMFANTNILPDCSNIDFTSQSIINSRGLNGLFAGTKVTDNDLRNILPINPTTNNYYLPATTLANLCYDSMFYNCINLTTAPELPATILVNRCYQFMFSGCKKLNYIKAMFTTTPSNSYTYNWVLNVASSGTFVKNSAATWNARGAHAVPNSWTIQTASE